MRFIIYMHPDGHVCAYSETPVRPEEHLLYEAWLTSTTKVYDGKMRAAAFDLVTDPGHPFPEDDSIADWYSRGYERICTYCTRYDQLTVNQRVFDQLTDTVAIFLRLGSVMLAGSTKPYKRTVLTMIRFMQPTADLPLLDTRKPRKPALPKVKLFRPGNPSPRKYPF